MGRSASAAHIAIAAATRQASGTSTSITCDLAISPGWIATKSAAMAAARTPAARFASSHTGITMKAPNKAVMPRPTSMNAVGSPR